MGRKKLSKVGQGRIPVLHSTQLIYFTLPYLWEKGGGKGTTRYEDAENTVYNYNLIWDHCSQVCHFVGMSGLGYTVKCLGLARERLFHSPGDSGTL